MFTAIQKVQQAILKIKIQVAFLSLFLVDIIAAISKNFMTVKIGYKMPLPDASISL